MKNIQYYKKALTIAGSDSGGGAGIQADLKAFSANGVYGMSAITAITAQNTEGVRDIHPVPVEIIESQIDSVMEDIGTDAVKIGMLHSSQVIKTVLRSLQKYQMHNVVLDPVMVATSGDKLLKDDAIETLIKELLPVASVITPNIPEAEIILDKKINTKEDFKNAARELSQTGAESVLLKSGHFKGNELTDIFYISSQDELIEIPFKRIDTKNTHGTGCTLSSAVASWLALGYTLKEAIRKGMEYTHQAILEGSTYQIGKGHGPVHHFYKFWS
ncbi:MAG: bifunctional hydroxymethylpyrimidine kinase/phosphomethylpyrimidine kinase [Bacteroidales bacterium]|nr:bifunctional hydroxymethylpyrimidine kinase/phosphomethylpyrimidine kinase [Bacteroidales bacterium]